MPTKIRRWRLQFRLGTALILMTLICLWLGKKAEYARKQQAAVAAVREVGGDVHFDYQYDSNGEFQNKARPLAPTWLRRMVGEDYFMTVVHVAFLTSPARGGGTHTYNGKVTDSTVDQLTALVHLKSLDIRAPQLTDAGMQTIGRLSRLESLTVYSTWVTDAGIAHLAKLQRLERLSIIAPRVSDVAMEDLTRLEGLQSLTLRAGRVTDDGLRNIDRLSNLRRLTLYGDTRIGISGSRVTEQGLRHVARLRQLENLSLNNLVVTEFGLRQLESLTNLKSASFLMTGVTHDGMCGLQQALPQARLHASTGGGLVYPSPFPGGGKGMPLGVSAAR